MGRDERAAFHFPFSRDQTIFRMMCLVTGSTSSPGVAGVMKEGLGFCGFIHRAGAFFFFFFPPFCHTGRTSRNRQYRTLFYSCLSSGRKWHCGVHASVTNPQESGCAVRNSRLAPKTTDLLPEPASSPASVSSLLQLHSRLPVPRGTERGGPGTLQLSQYGNS